MVLGKMDAVIEHIATMYSEILDGGGRTFLHHPKG